MRTFSSVSRLAWSMLRTKTNTQAPLTCTTDLYSLVSQFAPSMSIDTHTRPRAGCMPRCNGHFDACVSRFARSMFKLKKHKHANTHTLTITAMLQVPAQARATAASLLLGSPPPFLPSLPQEILTPSPTSSPVGHIAATKSTPQQYPSHAPRSYAPTSVDDRHNISERTVARSPIPPLLPHT